MRPDAARLPGRARRPRGLRDQPRAAAAEPGAAFAGDLARAAGGLRRARHPFIPGRRVASGRQRPQDRGARRRRARCPSICSSAFPSTACRAWCMDSGMAENGWIPVNPRTLETRYPGVYAVGDGANTGTPKAGVFAEGAARAVASELIAQAARGAATPAEYDGFGTCYIEFGAGRIGKVEVDFFSGPKPTGTYHEPSVALRAERIRSARAGAPAGSVCEPGRRLSKAEAALKQLAERSGAALAVRRRLLRRRLFRRRCLGRCLLGRRRLGGGLGRRGGVWPWRRVSWLLAAGFFAGALPLRAGRPSRSASSSRASARVPIPAASTWGWWR